MGHFHVRPDNGVPVSASSTPFSMGFKLVEACAIVGAALLGLRLLPLVIDAGVLNVPVAPLMLFGADVLSGVVHWAFDRWGTVETPLVGPNLIRTFREHHTDPLGITRHGFVEANGGPAMGAIVLLGLGYFVPPTFAVAAFWLGAFGFFTNVVHAWAHGAAPRPVRWLQRAGILLSADHHDAHHRAPHDRAYCITTGWANPLLDRLRVWDRLERAISAATGVEPCRG